VRPVQRAREQGLRRPPPHAHDQEHPQQVRPRAPPPGTQPELPKQVRLPEPPGRY